MKRKNPSIIFNDGWCFAIVNNRLAEIYFQKKYGIWAHCYIKRSKFNKGEQKMIDVDIKKYRFSYRKGFYIDKNFGIRYKVPNMEKIFPPGEKYYPLEKLEDLISNKK